MERNRSKKKPAKVQMAEAVSKAGEEKVPFSQAQNPETTPVAVEDTTIRQSSAELSPVPQRYFDLAGEDNYSSRIQLYQAIAEQIWREQQLVSTRMQWNFTFQAFLAGIYVFAGSQLDDWPRFLVQFVLSLSGLAVTILSLVGVSAAQSQSTRLKEHWMNEFHPEPLADVGECNVRRGAFPQPFSSSKGSIYGRASSRGVCWALIGMWGAMLGITVWVQFGDAGKGGAGAYSCKIDAAKNGPGSFDIQCRPASRVTAGNVAESPASQTGK